MWDYRCRQLWMVVVLFVLGLIACRPGQEDATQAPPAVPPAAAATANPASLILHNGVVWTGETGASLGQAVAIRGNAVAAVGSDAEILALGDGSTEVVDVGGQFVMPGFNDNHVHFASAARFLEFNIMKAGSQEEFEARVRSVTAKLPAGEWILGGFWGAYDAWTEGSAGGVDRERFVPDMRRVAALTESYPVFIERFDGKEFAANPVALRAVGVDPARPTASGVTFVLDEKREWTGIMRGDGVRALFEPAVPKSFSLARRIEQTKNALAEVRRAGVTNVSDMSDDMQLEIYRKLHERGELTVRVHFRYHLERYEELAAQGIKVGSGDAWIRLGGLKGHIDGIMGSSSARFFAPYESDPNNRGRWRRLMVDEAGEFAPGKFLGYMLGADKAQLQMSIHAIGDEANNVLLNYLDALSAQVGPRDRRLRLVHAQVIAPADMARLGKHGLVAEVQPFHLSDDMRWMEERIGRKRCEGAYAFRSILESGAVLSFGTDWPGTAAAEYPINPMLALYAATTRQTLGGQPAQGWFPKERIPIEAALSAYTLGSAYANFEDDIKGTLFPGKLADITVLSGNPLAVTPQELLKLEARYTIVDGKIVHRASP